MLIKKKKKGAILLLKKDDAYIKRSENYLPTTSKFCPTYLGPFKIIRYYRF